MRGGGEDRPGHEERRPGIELSLLTAGARRRLASTLLFHGREVRYAIQDRIHAKIGFMEVHQEYPRSGGGGGGGDEDDDVLFLHSNKRTSSPSSLQSNEVVTDSVGYKKQKEAVVGDSHDSRTAVNSGGDSHDSRTAVGGNSRTAVGGNSCDPRAAVGCDSRDCRMADYVTCHVEQAQSLPTGSQGHGRKQHYGS